MRGNSHRRDRYNRGYRKAAPIDKNRRGGNLGVIKTKIPSFQCRNDLEAYLEWEKKFGIVF